MRRLLCAGRTEVLGGVVVGWLQLGGPGLRLILAALVSLSPSLTFDDDLRPDWPPPNRSEHFR